MKRDLVIAALLFAAIWVSYSLSPNLTSFDSRWVIFTAESLVHDGDIDLREYRTAAEQEYFYGMECVAPDYRRTHPVSNWEQCRDGALYCYYPAAVPLLASPLVFLIEKTFTALHRWTAPAAPGIRPSLRPLFASADVIAARWAVELLIASLFTALAAAVMFLIARRFLSRPRAVALAGIFAFCTPAWSTASRGLWQHGPSILFLALTLWLLVLAEERPWMAALAGFPLAVAFTLRPANAVSVAVLTAYVLARHRPRLPGFLLSAAPVAGAFFAFSYTHYHLLLPPYFLARGGPAGTLGLHPRMAEALAGNLFSPSRGLLIFSPVLALAVWGWLRLRHPLRPYLGAAVAAHWILISSFADWAGGHSIGPRYFSDMLPYLCFLLIPVFQAGRLPLAALALLAVPSFWIHYRCSTRWEVAMWNVNPADINARQERLWDWRDPQFLR